MLYDPMQTTLRFLGINASNFKVLMFLPLAYEGWIADEIGGERESRLVNLVRAKFPIDENGEQILRGWLHHRPDVVDFAEGLKDILLLVPSRADAAFEMDELPGLIAFAEALALAAATTIAASTSVTKDEEQALMSLAREFGVNGGQRWGALVRELRAAN